MSQPRSADAVRSGALATQHATGPALAPRTLAPRNRMAYLLIVLVAIPVALVLALAGLSITNAAHSAGAYGQVSRLAALGQQVTGLARAMADERSATATFISGGRPAAGLPALRRQYATTDARAAGVRRLVSQLGHGYPAPTRAAGAQVLASIAKLSGLRRQATQGRASALAVITGYSAATSGLFPVSDGIANVSGNSTLISSVRALGSLSRMIDHASQQQAILGVALAERRFGPGALTALTSARTRQASDLASFRKSATAQESWALTETLTRPPARQAQAVEQRAIAAGNGALALGPQAGQQWSAGMSYTVGWMSQAEQQLAAWIPADAQALQRSETRSAIITGGAAFGALALFLLATILAATSMVRRRRRLEAAALEGAGAPLPSGDGPPLPGSDEGPLPSRGGAPLPSTGSAPLPSFAGAPLASSASVVTDGHQTPRSAEPLALVDVLQRAASEIKERGRIILDVQHGLYLSGSAADGTVHLLAELLENATTFSPETTQVMVSGHAVYGGGSLVTITDSGTGMSEEELTLLNRQLGNPSLADVTVARHMGLFNVAHLAARHGIAVTLTMPPDGGTTAEVYLPDALISLDAEPDGWQLQTDEAPSAEVSKEAEGELADLLFPPRRFASGPVPPLGPETGAPERVPALLAAPPPSPAPAASADVTVPEPADAEPGDGLPIFQSVRSGYFHAFGRDPLRFGARQAGHSPAERPAGPPVSWGDGSGGAVAGPPAARHPATSGPPTAGRPVSFGLPQRIPPLRPVRDATVDQKTRQASAAD